MRQGGGTAYDGVSASGRREQPADRRRRRRRGRPEPVPRLRERDRAAAARRRHEQRALRGRRQRLRHAVHVRPELPDVQHRRREAGADELGRHVRDRAQRQPNPYAGKITAYDSPIFIADAAMYLMTHQPGPRHHRPVRAHRGAARRGGRAAEAAGDDDRQVLGALHRRDRRLRRRLDGRRAPRGRSTSATPSSTRRSTPAQPTEGMTGWADTWMISANAPHPNCMLEWMN